MARLADVFAGKIIHEQQAPSHVLLDQEKGKGKE